MDYFLKAESEAALWQALEAAGIVESIDGSFVKKQGYDLDIIGVIFKTTGEIVEQIDGYHANIRTVSELTEEQIAVLPLIEAPSTPTRVWF